LLEHFDRRAVVALVGFDVVGQLKRPWPWGAAFGLGVALPSSAAIRAFRASFSSRSGNSHCLHRLNSSRLTKSMPPTHSRIFSRAEDSASRPIPATVRQRRSSCARNRRTSCFRTAFLTSEQAQRHGVGTRVEAADLEIERGRQAQPSQIGNQQPSRQWPDAPNRQP
jgi:hypothetical protein